MATEQSQIRPASHQHSRHRARLFSESAPTMNHHSSTAPNPQPEQCKKFPKQQTQGLQPPLPILLLKLKVCLLSNFLPYNLSSEMLVERVTMHAGMTSVLAQGSAGVVHETEHTLGHWGSPWNLLRWCQAWKEYYHIHTEHSHGTLSSFLPSKILAGQLPPCARIKINHRASAFGCRWSAGECL